MKFNIDNISKDLMPIGFQTNDKWTLWLQFDNDEPASVIENLRLGEKVSINWFAPGPDSVIKFTDPITKKTLTMFGRLDK